MKNSNDTSLDRTSDLPICSTTVMTFLDSLNNISVLRLMFSGSVQLGPS